MKKNLFIGTSITILLLFSGCSGGGSSSAGGTSNLNISNAFLSDSRIAGVTYTCGTTTGITDNQGKFAYTDECSEVTFSIGGISLGSIPTSSINPDSILYPSDLLGLDRNNTSDTQLTNMLQFFQSLDSDGNPNNGIDIDTNTTTDLEAFTLALDSNSTTIADINSTLISIGSTLIPREYAIAHYEDTLRQDLNISVDTVPPAPAVIVSMPMETYADTTSVTINGEVGAQVWIDGVYTNIDIDSNNSATLNINTSNNTDVNNTSSIVLKDGTNASSNATQTSIFRASIATLNSRDINLMKIALEDSSAPRAFSYTPVYTTNDTHSISFSETPRAVTVENQDYNVTATIIKGTATQSISFLESIAFSQDLRDTAEIVALKSTLSARNFTYAQQWATGEDYNVTFSEMTRAATTETQVYNIIATLTKGSITDTVTFSETVLFSQDLRDIMELTLLKSTITKRNFLYTQQWLTGANYSVTFNELTRPATTETQTYEVTANLTKGLVSDTVTFNETVPFSQVLRNIDEVNNALSSFTSTTTPRKYSYTNQWQTTGVYSITFSEGLRTATAIDQTYSVTITITIGAYTNTISYIEFVPTTNVNIKLGDGTTTLINDEYADAFTITNGGLFQKVGAESSFIGAAVSIDKALLNNITSSNTLLNYIVNNSSLSGLNSISLNNSADGSLIARYEITSVETNLYELLEGLLASLSYSINNIDFTLYNDVNNVIVNFYVEYDATNTSYVIVTLSDKNIVVDSDITKIVNKDSIVKVGEIIVNEQETFDYNTTGNRGDFIFVVDDSGSMRNEQAAATEAIRRTFSSAVSQYNLDWKATVFGTEEGRNYNSFVLNPNENNITSLTNQFNNLVVNGSDEVGLKRVYNYLLNNTIQQRVNSSLTVIYVSDEIEHTRLNEIGVADYNLSNSYFVQNDIRVNVIIPEDGTYQNSSANIRANDLAYKMAIATGGDVANLRNYASGYDQMMNLAVRYAVAKSSSIKLSHHALASSITVHVNGIKVTAWEYAPSAKAILFTQGNIPNIGAEVIVTYSHLD